MQPIRLLPLAALCLISLASAQVPAGYPGKPWHDTTQAVPGRLEPENYDEGNTGATWFDTGPHIGSYTARNSGVDLDAVHVGDPDVPGSTAKIKAGNVYWGWLEKGEWLKMTVDVKQAGTYAIHAMVGTADTGTSFKVDALQGTDSVSSGVMILPFTGKCPVECYHYWYYAKDVGTIKLKAGIQVIRMQIVKNGYNIEYVDLALVGASGTVVPRSPNTRIGSLRAGALRRPVDARGRRLPGPQRAPAFRR